MARLVGIKVILGITSGTNDHLYVGVAGRRGGKEFALRPASGAPGVLVSGFPQVVSGHRGTTNYFLGQVPGAPSQSMNADLVPLQAGPGGNNSPDRYRIDADGVHTVYLRKQGGLGHNDDDAVRLTNIEVFLFDANGVGGSQSGSLYWNMQGLNRRSVWLSNEHGLQMSLRQGGG